MKILIIADKNSRKKPWFQVFDTPELEIETTESVFEANDLFLTGLAMGKSYPLVVLHYEQNSSDAHRLMVYWKVQEPSIAVLYVRQEGVDTDFDLKEIGLLDTILENGDPEVLQNQFRFLMQGTRDRQILGIKMQLLEEPAQLPQTASALSQGLSIMVNQSGIDAAAFIQFSDRPEEPILQIVQSIDITDQFWLDELCDQAEETIVPYLQNKRMVVTGERHIFPIYSSRGWEGLLIFFIKEDSFIKSTDMESLSRTIHLLLERVRINEDLEKKISEKATYISLLNDAMKSSLKESAQQIDLLKLIIKDKKHLLQITKSENQISRSIHLLNDIVELSRIDDGLMVLLSQPVHLQSTLDEALKFVSASIMERNININFDPSADEEIVIEADEKKLTQVFYNLLFYLIKHCEKDESIDLSIFEGSKGLIFVKMFMKTPLPRHENCSQIFDRPETSFLLDENKVSLFICKQFIQAHEGQITAENDPITGFSFIIQLRTGI